MVHMRRAIQLDVFSSDPIAMPEPWCARAENWSVQCRAAALLLSPAPSFPSSAGVWCVAACARVVGRAAVWWQGSGQRGGGWGKVGGKPTSVYMRKRILYIR